MRHAPLLRGTTDRRRPRSPDYRYDESGSPDRGCCFATEAAAARLASMGWSLLPRKTSGSETNSRSATNSRNSDSRTAPWRQEREFWRLGRRVCYQAKAQAPAAVMLAGDQPRASRRSRRARISKPYTSARRVFWIVDNATIHRDRPPPGRLAGTSTH
jgi:hypothetical protein